MWWWVALLAVDNDSVVRNACFLVAPVACRAVSAMHCCFRSGLLLVICERCMTGSAQVVTNVAERTGLCGWVASNWARHECPVLGTPTPLNHTSDVLGRGPWYAPTHHVSGESVHVGVIGRPAPGWRGGACVRLAIGNSQSRQENGMTDHCCARERCLIPEELHVGRGGQPVLPAVATVLSVVGLALAIVNGHEWTGRRNDPNLHSGGRPLHHSVSVLDVSSLHQLWTMAAPG
jgi:hypothetical protein